MRTNRERLVVGTRVINEVCINMLRKAGAREESVRSLLRSFCPRYEVVSPDEPMMLTASELRERYGFSYWDSLIVVAAVTAGATFLYSEDMQSGQVIGNRLTAINPFQVS